MANDIHKGNDSNITDVDYIININDDNNTDDDINNTSDDADQR